MDKILTKFCFNTATMQGYTMAVSQQKQLNTTGIPSSVSSYSPDRI